MTLLENYTITKRESETILFSTYARDMRHAVELAVEKDIDLSYANLSGLDLSGGNFDGGHFAHADFSNSNLTQANMSEATLVHANFNEAHLDNICFAESDLRHARFIDSSMRASDMSDTVLNYAVFKDQSALTLNFTDSRSIENCMFIDIHDNAVHFSSPPILLRVYNHLFTFFSKQIIYKNTIYNRSDFAHPYLKQFMHYLAIQPQNNDHKHHCISA